MKNDQWSTRGRMRSQATIWALPIAVVCTVTLASVGPAAGKDTNGTATRCEIGEVSMKRDWTSGFKDIERLVQSKSTPKPFAQSVRPDMYKQVGDRDPIDVIARRTEVLLADVTSRPGARDLSGERAMLNQLKDSAEQLRRQGKKLGRTEFAEFRKLYWQIMLACPVIDFDDILFIKRHPSTYSHMCDQFLGKNARPGGGLFILQDAFSESPRIVDVLAESRVENGRLKGRKLAGGCFLSPDLSFDGETILFAYCECGRATSDWRPGWGVETCFHLFKVNVDGTNLVQLTDGELNDFDPCWLPNGRICFISERRGGYGRCHGGRDAPSYTLCSINPDGSDLVFLSYHESNEWHPSVTNDGRIIYSRWDYVDRGTNQAHHPWITTVDGRDARAIHGNYPNSKAGLHDRPWMEADLRAIPGSDKFVATACGHHGQAYGSLVVLDPSLIDDGAMSQLRRLTPELGFPEAERGGNDFATAWPLDEDYYLCARQGGIALIDAFGGRTFLYKSPDVPCLSPIPLKARPLPPRVPHQTSVGLPAAMKRSPEMSTLPDRATVAVINVYESLLPWPDGTRISDLRIVQIVPKPSNRSSGMCGTGKTNLRRVVGTVPVEKDGSAHFFAPTGVAVYFQALNERGMAVQSMRSSAYFHPGERLVCQGCHEPRHQAPAPGNGVPLALTRPPSEITPGPEGSNPLDYDLLVDSVFDTKCDACHKEKARSVKLDQKTVMKYVPHYTSPKPYEPSRTVPGEFGAMGSKFLKYLDKSHYGVDLTDDEFRRLVLWMDCNMATRGVRELSDFDKQRLAEFRSSQ